MFQSSLATGDVDSLCRVPLPRELKAARWLFWIGLVIAAWMVVHSGACNDQFRLLITGWPLYDHGELLPFGAAISGGGVIPGCATPLLSGLPQFLWADYRAANVLTLLVHAAAYLLLDRTLRGTLSPRERLLFCALFWLNPWQLFYGAHLWNPNWLILPAAIHFWSAFRQRREASFWPSLLHVVAIGVAFQLHGSFLLLVIVSGLAWWRGYMRLHWLGVACGALVVLLSLVPWMLAVLENRSLMPMHKGFIGHGLVYVHPTIKGIASMLRFSSMHYGRRMVEFDFTDEFGADWDAVLAGPLWAFATFVLPVTLALPVLANLWLWFRADRSPLARIDLTASDQAWLRGFVRIGWLGAIAACMLSPTSIQSFHVFIAMHFAVLPLVLWLGRLWDDRQARWVSRGLIAYVAVVIPLLVLMTIAAPMYRKTGRDANGIGIRADHPMLREWKLEPRNNVRISPGFGDHVDPWVYAIPGSAEQDVPK